MSIPHNNQGPPPAGPPPSNNNGPPLVVRPNGPALDFRSMDELCQPSINGQGGPISSIQIQATDFGLRHHMIQQQNGVFDDSLRLSLFPYTLTHHATAWYDRLLRNSIHTFDDMMRKFLLKYFPPSMVTKLRNEITKFRQDPNESLFEAWECYKLSINRCPNHNMLLVTQIDTFYNGLTLRHRDTINAAAEGTFMQKTPEECYDLIENMTAHHNHWDTSATRDETSRTISSTTTTESPKVVRQLEMMNKNFLDMMRQIQSVKYVNTKCETCGGFHSFTECPAVNGYTQEAAYATTGNHNSWGNSYQPGVAYGGPTILPTSSSLPKGVKSKTEAAKDKVQTTSSESTAHVQPSVVQVPILKPEVAPKPNPKPLIPYPSRLDDQKLYEKANNKMLKFLQIFQRLHFDISFVDALLYMPKFASTFKSLLKLEECLTLADLGASINLMPLSVWKKLSLSELTPTRMTLELANRSVAYPVGFAKDVFVKVGKFYFSADFVVVDYDVDPRVPLILGRPFLRTARALINVHGEELTLRVNDEAITFKVGHTSRYSCNYYDESSKQINVLDVACEEYAQEVLGFLDSSTSGNPSPLDPIISSSSPLFTPFKGEKLLNEYPSPNLPPMKNDDLKQVDVTMTKPSIEEPPELELKDLSSHLEYAFLEGTEKLPVIISKELKDKEKATLLKVLKSHKRAIAWKIFEIKGIDPCFCTHKILIEDDFKLVVQHQRRVNLNIHEVIKKEVIKLLDARLIYPISDSLFFYSKKNLAADHLSRLEYPHEGGLKKKKINETFPLETLGIISSHSDSSTSMGIDFMGPFPSSRGNKYILMAIDYLSKWVEDKSLPTNDARVVVMLKYRVTHRLSTAYHPQTSRRVKVSDRGLKRILERTIGENRASWFDKLDDALWAFRTAFRTPIGCTPYKLVYEKACHLPIKLEHKAYWALKHCNFYLKTTGDYRKIQMNE
nr:reverse transcriptase domain-containing protein [Tanacetum cinerariifolium]